VPERGPIALSFEEGWGRVLLFVEVGGDPEFVNGQGVAGRPVAGVEVLADGQRVATSDAAGLALVDLASAPASLEYRADGWRVHSREERELVTTVELRRE
jgi:hypothetical protein